jgi:hypothetical protein
VRCSNSFVERSALTRNIRAAIMNHALPAGGWAGGNGKSPSVETTCLALMALRDAQGPDYEKGRRLLEHVQNPDGSWPAFSGDDLEGCWTTSLAFIALPYGQSQCPFICLRLRYFRQATIWAGPSMPPYASRAPAMMQRQRSIIRRRALTRRRSA